jgi:hypothetical protein
MKLSSVASFNLRSLKLLSTGAKDAAGPQGRKANSSLRRVCVEGRAPRVPLPETTPAADLVEGYAHRWEHERFYRELQRPLRKSGLSQSHTVVPAAQQVAALILAATLRVSLPKLRELLRPFWLVLAPGGRLAEQAVG